MIGYNRLNGLNNSGNTNGIGVLPIVAAAVPLAAKIAPAIGRALGKLKNIIKKDDAVIALRDRFFKAFQAKGLGQAQWQTYVDKHKVRYDDIPKKKLLGNYNSETQRVIEFGAEIIQVFFPDKVDAFIGWMDTGIDPGDAAQKALSGQRPASVAPVTTIVQPIAPRGVQPAVIQQDDNNKKVEASGFKVDTTMLLIGAGALTALYFVTKGKKEKEK